MSAVAAPPLLVKGGKQIGIPLTPLRLLARLRREFRGLPPSLGIYVYSQKRVGNSLRRYLQCFRPASGRKK